MWGFLRLQLHSTIYRPDSFVLMLHHCVNLKVIRYESTSLNRIAADKSHRVIVALDRQIRMEPLVIDWAKGAEEVLPNDEF